MSRSEAPRGRWKIELCAACHGPLYECRDHRHRRREWVEVVTASSLSLALEALREIATRDFDPIIGEAGDFTTEDQLRATARAVLDQLEEGERR